MYLSIHLVWTQKCKLRNSRAISLASVPADHLWPTCGRAFRACTGLISHSRTHHSPAIWKTRTVWSHLEALDKLSPHFPILHQPWNAECLYANQCSSLIFIDNIGQHWSISSGRAFSWPSTLGWLPEGNFKIIWIAFAPPAMVAKSLVLYRKICRQNLRICTFQYQMSCFVKKSWRDIWNNLWNQHLDKANKLHYIPWISGSV